MTGEVIRGRIRVDARRAVEKLREHQLVDLHHYTHEIARAAVASGAERIVVEYDADDVVLRWHGDSLPAGALGRLLDHVLTEADDAAGRRLRLLAMGVNAALGLAPVFVDVYSMDDRGRCRRARWTTALLSDESEAETAQAQAPDGLGVGGVQVHVKRRIGWDVLRRATLGGVPREVSSLSAASRHLEAELVVAGEVVEVEEERVVAFVPLRLEPRLGAGLSARLEIVTNADRDPTLVFVEQGIELVRYALDPTPAFPADPIGALHLPVRVVVAAQQLPTNASRSAIREDSPVADAVVEASRVALVEAVEGLVARWRGEDQVPVGVTMVSDRSREIDEALGAFVSVVAGAATTGRTLHEASRRLLDLPILCDGLGRPTSYARLLDGGAASGAMPIYLHRGEALPEALSPWTRDVVMVRGGRRAEAALVALEHRDAAPLIEHAMAGLERRESHLAHAVTDVAVSASSDHVLVEAFAVDSGPFAGLAGEVALRATPTGRSTVRVFYEQRELAVQHLAPSVSPLPLDVALSWDDRLRVRFGFDGVEDDETLRSAIWYALQIGVEAVRRVVIERSDDPRIAEHPSRTAAWIRAAVRVRNQAWEALGLPERYRRAVGLDDPLWEVPAWRTLDGDHVSTASLETLVTTRSALCFVESARVVGRPLAGRIVLVVDEDQRRAIAEVLGREVIWVAYDRGLVDVDSWQERRERAVRDALDERRRRQGERSEEGLCAAFERPGARGLVAPAAQAERVVLHAGQVLTVGLFPRRFGPVTVVADDETVIPSPDWRGVAWSGKTWAPPSVEHELLVTLVAALEGDESAQRALGGDVRPASLGVVGRSYLALSFAALERELSEEPDEVAAAELVHLSARAVDLPVFCMAGGDGRRRWVSTGDILDAHGATGPIPTLTAEPGFASHDWHPLIVEDDMERAALRDWFGGRLVSADRHLASRRQRAAEEAQRLSFLAQPPIEPFELGDLAPGVSILGRHQDEEGSACVALLPMGLDATVIDVAYRCRPALRDRWLTYPLPVVARVSLEATGAFESSFRAITAAGREAARRLVALAAADLVRSRLADDDGRAMQSERFVTLVAELFGPAGPEDETLSFGDLLQRTARWPTVQGDTCRLPEARRGRGEIYIGRARYEPWRPGERPGALDRAVVHVGGGPLGAQHARILRELKVAMRDVSDAVDALQRRRAAGEDASSPALGGEPPHPRLRSPLSALGRAHGLTGELELTDGAPRLVVGDLSGPARDATTQPTIAVEAVVFTETVQSEERDERIAKRIDRLARRLIAKVAEGLVDGEALPSFARSRVREEVGRSLVDESELVPALRQAPVFVDTEGRWHSLAALDDLKGRQKPIWTTSGEPPYPERDDGRVILRLAADERVWMRRALPLRNMTKVLERTLEGQRRRTSEPVRTLVIHDELRNACLFAGTVSGEGFEGEVGILAPERESLRGIAMHVGGRPLCHLDDRPGWPICGVVDDEHLRPNPFFDGPRQIDDGDRAVARVRSQADALFEVALEAPDDAIVSRFVDATDERRGLRIRGRLWLEVDVVARASVTMLTTGERPATKKVPLVRLHGPEGLDRTLPVGGVLFVEHLPREKEGAGELLKMAAEMAGGDASHHYATELALEAAASMVNDVVDAVSELELDRVRWTLALLEAPISPPPIARGTEGDVTAAMVRDELGERQTLWYSRRRGDVEGSFPGTPPRFVLTAGENEGLFSALKARSTRPILREVGGTGSPVALGPRGPRGARGRAAMPAPLARYLEKRRQVAPEAEPQEPLVDPLFSGLVSTVRAWFGGGVPAPVPTTLREIVEGAIAGLGLPGDPVLAVGFSRRGRAVRYQKSQKRIVINRDHPTILALIPPDDEVADTSLRLVLAAVVSELNRAQETVTATAELEALRYLLESRKV